MKNLSIPISDDNNVAITDINVYFHGIIIVYNSNNIPVGFITSTEDPDVGWLFNSTICIDDGNCWEDNLVDLIKRFSEYNFKVIEFTEQCTI